MLPVPNPILTLFALNQLRNLPPQLVHVTELDAFLSMYGGESACEACVFIRQTGSLIQASSSWACHEFPLTFRPAGRQVSRLSACRILSLVFQPCLLLNLLNLFDACFHAVMLCWSLPGVSTLPLRRASCRFQNVQKVHSKCLIYFGLMIVGWCVNPTIVGSRLVKGPRC